ncbi:HNH endonuclease [Desulfovibrio sp. OttesenSCG-928-A18]|nr:HNH endonuclease [Desulfovibrio sp. OttesenSCG-928-A18]
MAQRPHRPCRNPGCRALTQESNGYCAEHQHIAEAKERERQRRGDERRESASKRGYGRWWSKVRERALKAEPLCRECKASDRITPAVCVHHIDENPRNNERKNLMPLCFDCHEKAHGRMR